MKNLRTFFASLSLAAAFLVLAGGCGGSGNTVVAPGELTPEQEAEMGELGEQLESTMGERAASGPSKGGN